MKSCLLYTMCLVLILVTGCATHTLTGNKNEPEWVHSPQIAGEKVFGRDAFYGAGKSGYGDIDVGLSEARDEARREVAAALQTEVDKMSEKVMNRISSGAMEQNATQKTEKSSNSFKSHFQASEKNIVRRVITGSTIVTSWRDPSSGTTWALAKIDKEQSQRAMIDEFKNAANAAVIEMGHKSKVDMQKMGMIIEEVVHGK